jgi:hypothetical protein
VNVKKTPPRRRAPPRVTAIEADVAPPVATRVEISAQARYAMIQEAAYLRAERRGFAPGHDTEDWLSAEAEVDALLKEGQNTTAQ